MISFFVDADPVAQPRQRHAIRNGVAINYIPKNHPIHVYKEMVALRARTACNGILEGPVGVTLIFLMPRPQAMIWKTKPMPRVLHDGKPDFDNLAKAIADALNGIAWKDDAQIARCVVEKYYAAWYEPAGVHVQIESM